CAVIPLVRAGNAVVGEFVANRLPRLAAVVGTLNQLSEPASGLRGVDSIRIRRRALQMINLPAREMRSADVPFFALAVGRQNEGALARTHQHSDSAHTLTPPASHRDRWGSAYQKCVARMCGRPVLPSMTRAPITASTFLCSQFSGARAASSLMHFSLVRNSPAAAVPYWPMPPAITVMRSVAGFMNRATMA